MSAMTCAAAPRFDGAAYRLPFGIGFVVLERGPRLRATLTRLAMRPVIALRNRRTVAALSAMDARQLGDIGLTRADVIAAADAGAFGRPLDTLRLRAEERAARALGSGV